MTEKLLIECSIDILGHKVGVKIYKNEDNNHTWYSFKLSDYFQDENQMDVYRPGGGSLSHTLEELLFKLQLYKEQVKKIVKIEHNEAF